MKEVKYLGHITGSDTVRPLTDNLQEVRNFLKPTTNKKQFLVKVNFYQKYIPNTAKVLEPFHQLLRKNVSFVWTKECYIAFDNIKSYLKSSLILAIFNKNLPINIYTNASWKGAGQF